MATTHPVNWFEIPVSDLKRATRFYEAVFGVRLAPNEMGPHQFAFFPMERGSAGASGTLAHGPGYTPSQQGTLVYFSTGAIDASLKKIEKAGGKTLLPRTGIGQYGFIAHFEDSEGNRVALHEPPVG